MIKEITKFIESKTSFVINADLFAGHRPEGAPDRCQVVLESSGGSIISDLPDRADMVIQILSRGNPKYYFQPRDDAWTIYDALFRNHPYGSAGWTLPVIIPGKEYEAMVIIPLAIPQNIGQDEKLRWEFSTNYIVKIRDKNA